MYDFNKTSVVNHGTSASANSWTTKCLSIVDDAAAGITALSCDCIMEDVPFSKKSEERTKQIILSTDRFYTLHSQGEWFTQRNLSNPDTIIFYDSDSPQDSIIETIGRHHKCADKSNPYNQNFYLPIAVQRLDNPTTLDYSFSRPYYDWHQKSQDLIGLPILFAPSFGGSSSINEYFAKPTHKYLLDSIHGEWDPVRATLGKMPIMNFSCAIELPGKTIYFPLRYVNHGKNYIQPISGKIAIANGITGTIVFAYNFASREVFCEFSMHCHTFSSPYCATVRACVAPLEIESKKICLYTFA